MQEKIDIIEVAKSFAKAKNTYKQHAIIQEKMRYKLIEILKNYGQNRFLEVFEFGVGEGEFSEILQANINYTYYIANDINFIENLTSKNLFDRAEIFDMNTLHAQHIFKKKFDLIASNACLQWLKLKQTLQNLSTMLKPNGILLLSTFGEQNLTELAQIADISLEYASLKDIWKILKNLCNLEILTLQEERITLDFDSSFKVFKHLQKSGTNALKAHQTKLNKTLLSKYQAQFGGRITYHPIYILARKKSII